MSTDVRTMLVELECLAQRALSVSDADVEIFLEAADAYLLSFQEWKSDIDTQHKTGLLDELEDSEKASMRQQIELLTQLHRQVLDKADRLKVNVSSQMGSAHRKAQALKSYVDRYPGRISITGKRQG